MNDPNTDHHDDSVSPTPLNITFQFLVKKYGTSMSSEEVAIELGAKTRAAISMLRKRAKQNNRQTLEPIPGTHRYATAHVAVLLVCRLDDNQAHTAIVPKRDRRNPGRPRKAPPASQ